MRPNFNHNQQKNSQQIQMHIAQKAKSRNRVIGSVVILLCTLAILLNVTSNVKQINISPSVVEIKTTAIASEVISSAPIAVINQNSIDIIINEVTDDGANSRHDTQQTESNEGFKAGVISKTTKSNDVIATENNNQTVTSINKTAEVHNDKPVKTVANTNNKQPTKLATTTKKPSNPEDILDGIADGLSPKPQKTAKPTSNSGGKSYIQFAALSSEVNANKLKQELISQGVNASIKQIETPKGVLYRLRAGPFSSEEAQSKLQQIKANGYSGMITGN